MESRACVICGASFNAKRESERKSCSYKCRTQLQMRTIGHASSQIHGFARVGAVERLHGIWRGMLKRCNCPTVTYYDRYGGRGIKVCAEWTTDYVAFRNWAFSNGYQEGLTIGRMDNDGDYNPSNCRWESHKQQARNRRSSHFETYNGETKTLAEWAELYGIQLGTLTVRVNVYKMPIAEALTKPIQKAAQYLVDGEMLTIDQLAAKYGIKPDTLRYRLKHMPVKKALEMRPHEKTR